MDIVIPISGAVILIVALVGTVELATRRRHRRIAAGFAARGIKVVAVRFTTIPSMRDVVEYISPEGELRQASILRGAADLFKDVPFQVVLKERYEQEKSELIRVVKLAAAYSRLPGFDDYKSLVRELAACAGTVTIEESASSKAGGRRFAPMLQCLETMSIGSKNTDRLLELTVDGTRIDVGWSVRDEPPKRQLVVTAARPRV